MSEKQNEALKEHLKEKYKEKIKELLPFIIIGVIVILLLGSGFFIHYNKESLFNYFKNISFSTPKEIFVEFKNWIINPDDNLKPLRNNFLIYLLTFIILIILTISFFYYSNNKIKFSIEIFLYIFIILIPIVLLFYYLKPQLANISNVIDKTSEAVKSSREKSMIIIFITLFVFINSIIYFSMKVTPKQVLFTQYLFIILLVMIIIIGLAMTFLMFIHYFRTMTGTTGFLLRLIFYIPCLFIDLLQYIKNELKITANNVYILFIIELLLILCYLYLPYVLNKITVKKGITILKDSRFLDKEYILPNDTIITLPKKSTDDPSIYRQNFAISLWLYVNPQSNSFKSYSKETNIIDIDNSKPKITYINNNDNIAEKNKLIFYFGDIKHTIHNKGQKWNNIVINCNTTIVDIFINGNLERTITLSEPLDFTNTGTIKLGSNDGLDGAICNVMYYNEPLTKNQIASSYNFLMLKNPPTME
jgi:hypothetical protein